VEHSQSTGLDGTDQKEQGARIRTGEAFANQSRDETGRAVLLPETREARPDHGRDPSGKTAAKPKKINAREKLNALAYDLKPSIQAEIADLIKQSKLKR